MSLFNKLIAATADDKGVYGTSIGNDLYMGIGSDGSAGVLTIA